MNSGQPGYAYNRGQTGVTIKGPGSDSGLMNRVMANLNSTMDLLTSLAELPETIAMLLSAANAIVRAAKLFSKGRLVDGLKALGKYKDMSRRNQQDARRADRLQKRTVESSVLEFNMGWKPFVNDINSSIEALHSSFQKGKRLRKTSSNTFITGAGRKAERSTRGYSKDGKLDTFTPRTTISISGTIANSQAAMIASLGLNNPASVAWELTPYSFLVDYFIDVGNFIGALTGLAGLSGISGTKATTTVTRLHGAGGVERGTIVDVRRSLVQVKWTLPGLNLSGFSTTQVVNMAALMKQRLPRR